MERKFGCASLLENAIATPKKHNIQQAKDAFALRLVAVRIILTCPRGMPTLDNKDILAIEVLFDSASH